MSGPRSPAAQPEIAPQRAWTEMIMGLPISIHLRTTDFSGPPADGVVRAYNVMRWADTVFSPFRADSVLSRVNRNEISLDEAGPSFRTVLRLADRALLATDGAFDVRAAGTLDPCGIVKTWAAQRAARLLPPDSYLNAGGDISLKATGAPWRIGVEDPADSSTLLAVFALRRGGLATSGTAHRGHHIIDPVHRRPAAGITQVTVVGPSLMWADIWATALVARGAGILDAHDCLLRRCVDSGYQVLGVSDDARVWQTPGLTSLLDPLGGSPGTPLACRTPPDLSRIPAACRAPSAVVPSGFR